MRFSKWALLLLCLSTGQILFGQPKSIDKVQFFADETTVPVTIEADWNQVYNQKNKIGRVFPARIIINMKDTLLADESIDMVVRGHFRRSYCGLPPLKLTFKKTDSSIMHPLKSLKLVSPCRTSMGFEEYIFKEYLVYKIFNLLTDKSFRVRLLKIDYKSPGKDRKSNIQHAFLMEDIKDLARRNQCKEWDRSKVNTESTDRKQMTLVNLFEYMIGNTDWSVTALHNIKLIYSKEDSLSRPFAVPYDFDYSGLVSTNYSIPDPNLPIETVQQRLYRGFPRTLEEINEALEVFKSQKEKIYAMISNFDLLDSRGRKDMLNYLDEFYYQIGNQKRVKSIFVDNARRE